MNRITRLFRTAAAASLALLTCLAAAPPTLAAAGEGSGYGRSDAMLDVVSELNAAVADSIVQVRVGGRIEALGVIVGADGWVVTKSSELDGTVRVRLPGGEEVSGKVVVTDEAHDLALIQVDADGLTPVQWSSAATRSGQWLVTAGPGSRPHAVGIVSVEARQIPGARLLLGVQLASRDDEVRIQRVLPEFGAAEAGLQAEDVIVRVDDEPTSTLEDVMAALDAFAPGQVVRVHVLRGDRPMPFDVRLRPAPRNPMDRNQRMNRMSGQMSQRADDFPMALQHDTVLEPDEVGGPVLDIDGNVVGLNIARAGRIASYALPAQTVRQVVDQLREHAEERQRRSD
jgi:serine protease Do